LWIGGIELLHIQQIRGHGVRIAMAFAAGRPRPLIDQPQHAFVDKTAGFVPDGRPLQSRLATAFRDRFGKEDNRTNDFVVMLHVINAVELILRELLCSRHAVPLHQTARPCPLQWNPPREEPALCRCFLSDAMGNEA
jgi:hypothetical protein